MEQLPFYIITSDATAEILPASCYLYNKYWLPQGGQHFKILGNHGPKENLPENFEFVKIKDENNIQKWTRYLHDYILNNETGEYFVLALDDYLPNAPLDTELFGKLVTYAKTHEKIGRLPLGRLDVESWDRIEDYLVKLKPDSVYRLSCQISVWNREYFLKYFNHDWTPWQLELEGSKLAKNDGWEIVGTNGAWAFGWMEESALSGRWPGMVNILGLKPEDVKQLIGAKTFDPARLQYGIWYDTKIPFISRFQSVSKKLTRIPKFSEIGYGFKWDLIKPYIRSKTFKRLLNRYKAIYP